jgi:uncharacterized membrane protein
MMHFVLHGARTWSVHSSASVAHVHAHALLARGLIAAILHAALRRYRSTTITARIAAIAASIARIMPTLVRSIGDRPNTTSGRWP